MPFNLRKYIIKTAFLRNAGAAKALSLGEGLGDAGVIY
jgi:hypothetical protein